MMRPGQGYETLKELPVIKVGTVGANQRNKTILGSEINIHEYICV